MRWFRVLAVTSLICLAACQKAPLDLTAKTETENEAARREAEFARPPFATKEPTKYQAKIVFSFKFHDQAENIIEQTTVVARDATQQRIDFEIGDGKKVSRLVTADGKHLILLPKQKVYAEIAALDENFAKTVPSDFSLEHLLHTKPVGARFERLGAEEIAGRQTTKYRLVFDKVTENGNTSSETLVWADENLGLPIRTEVVSLVDGKPTGAKSIMELSEIKIEPDRGMFELPSDYRKVSSKDAQDFIRPR
jgi:hypothetical protein